MGVLTEQQTTDAIEHLRSNAVEARGFSLRRRATYFILPAIPRGEKLLAGVVALVTALVVLARVAILLGTWEGAPWSRSG